MDENKFESKDDDDVQPECGSIEWICEDTYRALQMGILLVMSCSSVLFIYLFYVWDRHSTFVMIGPLVILTTIYAASHFRTLMRLKKSVQRMTALATKVDNNLKDLRHTLKEFKERNDELTENNKELQKQNRKFGKELNEFQELKKDMCDLSAQNEADAGQLRYLCDEMVSQWLHSLEEYENNIFVEIHRFVTEKSASNACTLREWHEILDKLPSDYQKHWNDFGGDFKFNTFAGSDNNDTLDLKELRMLLNRFIKPFLIERKVGVFSDLVERSERRTVTMYPEE